LLNTCTHQKTAAFDSTLSTTVFGNHTRCGRANSMYDNNNPMDGQFSSTPKYLSNKHLIEWCEESAVSEAIARLNIESLTDKEFNERIRPKEPIKTGGWWCSGVNWRTGVFMGTWYGQGKPDKPHHPEGSKERKYLTASGMEPDAIFLAMPDKGYWAKVHADLSIPRHWAEGVKKAGAGLSLGLAVLALTGVWNWGKDGKLAKFVEEWAQPGTTHYIDFDSDYVAKPSCRAAIIKFAQLLIERGCTVHITCWDANFKGLDDFIVGKGGDAFLQAVADASAFTAWEKQLKKNERKTNASKTNNSITPPVRTQESVVCLSSFSSNDDYIPDTAPIAGQNFILKAEDALYSDGHYVSIGGLLYRFTGSYYEELNESSEKRRIGGWLKSYSEKVKGTWVKNRADTASVNAVFSWVVNQTAVDPVQVNPGGLNCTNGVVKINPDGSHLLVPHDPKNIYTYVGCKYDPNIDLMNGDRLLECLEPSQREIFLRTAAAALNLKLVRSKLTGRGVKGLLCYGEGSNGKDTLRAVLAVVFGRGMTGKSLSDFKSYDMGRKFTLAGIEGSICNWASENTAKVDLDNIQSLKQFITGDPIDIERKGKDSYEYKPAAIFFANCNKLPSITGGTAAIDDRYGILRFDKTYARNAIAAEGQLEADPRFKDDEKFILEQVAPAMLNKLLERLPLLLAEGIDYKATKDAMQKAQEESHHLWQFAREVGLEVQSGGRVWITDLWDLLVDWYEGMGVLDKELDGKGKEKLIWHELSNKYDAPVKSINQLSSRFSEIFPKVQVCKYLERDEMERRGQRYLLGVGFVQGFVKTAKTSVPSVPVDIARDTAVPSSVPKNSGTNDGTEETLTQSGGTDGTDDFSPFAEVCKLVAQFTHAEWQKLIELRAQSQQLPNKVTPEDAQVMRDIALVWWLEYYPEQIQALLTQMYGWQAPGTKYNVATLAEWLEKEDELIRDRITQLINRRKS
jgi:putative DNA primase/helicase